MAALLSDGVGGARSSKKGGETGHAGRYGLISVRTQNVLYNNAKAFGVQPTFPITKNDLKVSDIGKLSLRVIGGFRNCGKKTLLEIKELCTKAGVELRQERIDRKYF